MENERINKDRKTLEAIGRIYCAAHHAANQTCSKANTETGP